MLTEMQDPIGPTSGSIPLAKPELGNTLDSSPSGPLGSAPKTVSLHRPSESLRYLLRHLSASRSLSEDPASRLAQGHAEQQER
jgi:hypothetical protein